MTSHCVECGGAGWMRRYSIGGPPEPLHCPKCGDGALDPEGFADSELVIDELRARIKPSTEHTAGD